LSAAGLGEVATGALSSRADRKNKKTSSSSAAAAAVSHADGESHSAQPVKVMLTFKRNVFDPRKQMLQ